MNAERVFIGR